MTSDELQQARACIQQISSANISELLAKAFPDINLSEKRVHLYSYSEFAGLIDRVVEQFRTHIEDADARYWPNTFYYHCAPLGTSQCAIISVLNNLATYLNGGNWDHAAYWLEVTIGYQMNVGIWHRDGRRWHSVSRLRHHELFTAIELKDKQLQMLISEVQGLKAAHAAEINRREQDAVAVAAQLSTATKQAEEVSHLLTRSTQADGQLEQILVTQKSNLDRFNTELTEIDKGRKELAETLKTAADKLTISEGRLKFMESKADWVNELAGTAAAGVLGEKFESRKKQLASSSKWWLGGTVGAAVLGALWLGIAHKYFMHEGGDFWLTLALNFGLLLPAIFIVGFFAKQFGKVRQFEEEYAFRSSVAMTLGAFADRLTGSDDERNRLITETVEKLYRLPVLLQEKESHGWFSQRSTERMVKATTELVSAVKGPPTA